MKIFGERLREIRTEIRMANIEIIKRRLRETIKQSSLTQTQLAKRLSVSPSCIAHYVKGDILPSIDKLADLCEILDVDSAYILGLN